MNDGRHIINTNIRLDLSQEADNKAWEYLQKMDRRQYKSYSRAVVTALNDYFGHKEQSIADPYLETREKEDAFLQSVQLAVKNGVQAALPLAAAQGLAQLLQGNTDATALRSQVPDADVTAKSQNRQEQDAATEDALAFVDSL